MQTGRVRKDVLREAIEAELPDDESTNRILRAALEHAEDFGLRRFTVDEVARRVGLSRVTIYRHFPKKDKLLKVLIMSELRRFLTKADTVIAAQSTPEAKLIEGLTFAVMFLREHKLLSRLLRTEPEFLLPYLTVKAGDFLAAARNWIAGHIRAEVTAGHLAMPDEDIDIVAEVLARNVLSLVLTPETLLPLDSPEGRQRLAELYFIPIVRALRP
ncbi:TetR family transcriptional regulator [Herbihabitans rhizosphaerae]|uniref:TetR family transcriptional regulator n=1 Tax=Herbihabitans rhizosphaerae TaxID=1872711 RepID=A0A4Q7KGX1_9PSEU|nr:TetR/AcrR family transcriptional regulator [Herbihabitans rhizosphaerae]RZS32846.1 TetR family transcriptional regulator [Herbihabitans rhizosphaerae]